MKKLFLLISVAICASLLLSSCSRMKDFSITKRHYRSGYTVDFGTPKQDINVVKSNSKFAATEPCSSISKIAENKSANTEEKNKTVSLKKENHDSSPAYFVRHEEKKNDKLKSDVGITYASNDNSTIGEDVKSENLENQNIKLSKAISDSSNSSSESPMWLLIVFCIILPPLAVGLKFGIIDKFWISCLLTVLFWIPGVIYALIVVTRE